MLALQAEHYYSVETAQRCENSPAPTTDCEIFLRSAVKQSAGTTFGGDIAIGQRPIKGAITER